MRANDAVNGAILILFAAIDDRADGELPGLPGPEIRAVAVPAPARRRAHHLRRAPRLARPAGAARRRALARRPPLDPPTRASASRSRSSSSPSCSTSWPPRPSASSSRAFVILAGLFLWLRRAPDRGAAGRARDDDPDPVLLRERCCACRCRAAGSTNDPVRPPWTRFVTPLGLVFDPFVIWVIFASAGLRHVRRRDAGPDRHDGDGAARAGDLLHVAGAGARRHRDRDRDGDLRRRHPGRDAAHSGNAGVGRLHRRELRHVEEGPARPQPRRQPRLLGARRAVRGRDPDRRGAGARRVRDQLLLVRVFLARRCSASPARSSSRPTIRSRASSRCCSGSRSAASASIRRRAFRASPSAASS